MELDRRITEEWRQLLHTLGEARNDAPQQRGCNVNGRLRGENTLGRGLLGTKESYLSRRNLVPRGCRRWCRSRLRGCPGCCRLRLRCRGRCEDERSESRLDDPIHQYKVSAAAANTTGSDQAQSRSKETPAAPTTHPTKKPTRRLRAFFHRSLAPSISGWSRDSPSSSESTLLVKFPVITAVEGAPDTARRKRANWHAMADTATMATEMAMRPCGLTAGSLVTLNVRTHVSSRK